MAVWHWPSHRWFIDMSLSVICVSEHANHSDSEKSSSYLEETSDSEQMFEILSELLDEFMMDLCFPALRSAGCAHCNDGNVRGWAPISILVFKTTTKQNQMFGFWPYEYTQEQRLEKNLSENDKSNLFRTRFPLPSCSIQPWQNSVWLCLNSSLASVIHIFLLSRIQQAFAEQCGVKKSGDCCTKLCWTMPCFWYP